MALAIWNLIMGGQRASEMGYGSGMLIVVLAGLAGMLGAGCLLKRRLTVMPSAREVDHEMGMRTDKVGPGHSAAGTVSRVRVHSQNPTRRKKDDL
jgi:hypothetical protein